MTPAPLHFLLLVELLYLFPRVNGNLEASSPSADGDDARGRFDADGTHVVYRSDRQVPNGLEKEVIKYRLRLKHRQSRFRKGELCYYRDASYTEGSKIDQGNEFTYFPQIGQKGAVANSNHLHCLAGCYLCSHQCLREQVFVYARALGWGVPV